MAVPKKRTGKSAQAKRRANWKATVPATTTCKNCGAVVLTHTVCTECGTYKNKAVSIKSKVAKVEEETKVETPEVAKEEVKETKKTSKKAKETEASTEEKPKRTRKTKKVEEEAKSEDKE